MTMNSVMVSGSRYTAGGATETKDGAVEYWNKKLIPFDDSDSDYEIEKIFEGRPDKLAFVLYGNSRLWWIICQMNSIIDIPGEFIEGATIRVPSVVRAASLSTSTNIGGITSKRELSPDRRHI